MRKPLPRILPELSKTLQEYGQCPLQPEILRIAKNPLQKHMRSLKQEFQRAGQVTGDPRQRWRQDLHELHKQWHLLPYRLRRQGRGRGGGLVGVWRTAPEKGERVGGSSDFGVQARKNTNDGKARDQDCFWHPWNFAERPVAC